MISVIIRTRNEARWIGHAIQSILDNFPNDETEIKILDNESDDETLQIVKMFKEFNLEIITIPRLEYTPGRALNVGLNSTSSESKISCIMSAHCAVERINLDLLQQHMEDRRCFGIMGKQIPIFKGKRLASSYVWENFTGNKVLQNLRENDKLFFHNAFSFINMDVWRENRFNEELTGKEDREWADRLYQKDFHFLYDPAQRCFHHWTESCATWNGMG